MRAAHLGRTARLLLGGLSAGLLLLASGCADQSVAAPSESHPRLPNVSELSPRELISYAEQALVGDCLREQGFEHHPIDPSSGDPEEDPEQDTKESESDPNIRYVAGLSDEDQQAYRFAFFGDADQGNVQTTIEGVTTRISTNGCLAEARKRLYGDLEAWYRPHVIAGNVHSLARRDVLRDPRYENKTKTARELERHYVAVVRAKYRTELDRLETIEAAAADRARQILRSG